MLAALLSAVRRGLFEIFGCIVFFMTIVSYVNEMQSLECSNRKIEKSDLNDMFYTFFSWALID